MSKLLSLRAVSPPEEEQLQESLRGRDAFALRRAQIVLGRGRGASVEALSQQVGCSVQTVRNVIRAFNSGGVECLHRGSHRPKSASALLDEAACERLKEMLHQCPRLLGHPSSVWTLSLVAREAHRQGLVPAPVSDETIRRAFGRERVGWKRAKAWITSPDPQYALKKSGESG